jgi:hypothetical protein
LPRIAFALLFVHHLDYKPIPPERKPFALAWRVCYNWLREVEDESAKY